MLVIEVNNGFCRKPIEVDVLPRSTITSIFVDITNVEPKPDEFWEYDYRTKQFTPPENPHDYELASTKQRIWNDVRNTRQIYLMETDWTQLPDSPLSWLHKREFKKYRQAIRDIPQVMKDVNPAYIEVPRPPNRSLRPCGVCVIKKFFKLLFSRG